MAKNLVIVESPAKVKTIAKFLGSNYSVAASNGHVRDLPKSTLGIDVEHDFEPKYITIRGKGDVLANLRKEVKKADKIYLATDPDREGEAISWHLMAALKLEDKKVYRITFNEITKGAIKESLKHAREIDMDLVDAQQARRCLDRCVGYRISPLLWAKVKRGLSAGRVQSVALRIIADREDEINAFVPEEYWTLEGSFAIMTGKSFVAKYSGEIKDSTQVAKITEDLEGTTFSIIEEKRGTRNKKAPLPFTTSTLQQEASKALNFSTTKTMRIAQQLYEGIEIKGQGTVGVITYLRTDSTRVSDEAIKNAAEYIANAYGDRYVGEKVDSTKTSGKIQDAHEAIRPTDLARTPQSLKDSLNRDQLRLYTLIYKRFVASRMSDAIYETISVKIGAGKHVFVAASSKVTFDGFRTIYTEADEEKEVTNALLNELKKGDSVSCEGIEPKQHFTQPPAHYTEASLVRTLEELGIGRPSTYAPTISTILARRYIVKEGRNIFVTELGEIVNNMMKEAFPSIVDVTFTANMESLLDAVEEGNVKWKTIIANFYPDLDSAVNEAQKQLDNVEVKEELSGENCELCGAPLYIKYGPHGKFQACSGFPNCRFTKPYYEKIDVACPNCGKDIVLRASRKGRKYYGCIDNPECDFMSWQRPSGELCPVCGKMLLVRGTKLVCMSEECNYSQNRSS